MNEKETGVDAMGDKQNIFKAVELDGVNLSSKKDAIFEYMRDNILRGALRAGEKLPKEVDLARRFGVARDTLRAALQALEKRGYIVRVKGKGTFVNPGGAKRPKYLILEAFETIRSPAHIIVPLLETRAARENIALEKCSYFFFRDQPAQDSLRLLKSRGFSGIIDTANNYRGDEQILDVLRKSELPVVMVHGGMTDAAATGLAVVRPSYPKAFEDGIRHLTDKGHRRVAALGSPTTFSIRLYSKSSFMKSLAENRCVQNQDFFALCDYREEAVFDSVRQLMSLPRPPTAIACSSDFFAMFVYKALRQLGRQIPNDVAVLGFGNFSGGQIANPPLSSVDLGNEEATMRAFQILEEADKWFGVENVIPPEMIVAHTIVERESTIARRIEHELATVENGCFDC